MNEALLPGRRAAVEAKADRAVIDIGSNTVRLVVFSGGARAPLAWHNEKVVARLGRDLATSCAIPPEAEQLALAALGRYALLLPEIDLKSLDVVATAAAREAKNGRDFLDKVRTLGIEPRLLSGEQEAQAAAHGVIGAFPGAHGVVADLGGGSLELVSVEGENVHHGASLPLGTLRLAALRDKGADAFRQAVHAAFETAGWAAAHPGPLYMVGGTWRALATYAMRKSGHPLTDPHALSMDVAEADTIAAEIAASDPTMLAGINGIAEMRAEALPDAAAMLRVMLAELEPTHLVFSSWGLREGLLFERLGPVERAQDPLLAGIAQFAAPRGGSARNAASIAAWTSAVGGGRGSEGERLRLAAAMLALAARQLEPNIRLAHAQDWALHKRWIGLDMPGRALIAAALLGAMGKPHIPEALLRLTPEAALREAVGWGLAIRLCRRIGAGSRLSLMTSALRREDDTLLLWFDEDHGLLHSDAAEADLAALADWLGLSCRVTIGGPAPD